MLWHAMPPEVNTARLMAGTGPAPMLAAATGWEAWATALDAQAAEVLARLNSLSEVWTGAGSDKAIAAATPMVSWLAMASGHAKSRASQATAQAAAYTQAMTDTPSLPEIAMNRITTAVLTATNFLGINTVPIASSETDYFIRMWNQAAAAMDAYQAETIINTRFEKLDPMKAILSASISRCVTTGFRQATTMARQAADSAKDAIRQAVSDVSGMSGSLQQLAQLVTQTTSLFSQTGGMGAEVGENEGAQIGLLGASPLSNHPLAGGSGPSVGSGLMRADFLPGADGSSARTPLMAQLLDKPAVPLEPAGISAPSSTVGGTAPLGSMGHGLRAAGGSSRPGLLTPASLVTELDEIDQNVWDDGEEW